MNIINDFNKAIDYIEKNLENEINVDKVAKIAGSTSYYFMRMFSAITGVGVYEYIRKRRMTKASEELQKTNIKIIDLAFKYGYDSPTAFNRAFKDIHGVSPSKAREEKTNLKSYLPMSFKLTVKGVEEMEYYIEEIKGFRAVGLKRSFNFKNGENFEKIPFLWKEVMENGTFNNIMSLMDSEPIGVMGISANLRENDFDYYIAVSSSKDVPNNMEELLVPTESYAIFTCTMDKIQDTTRRIYGEWLPSSEYKHVENAPELEIYPDEKSCKICIPIEKLKK